MENITSIPKHTKHYRFSFLDRNNNELKSEVIEYLLRNLKDAKKLANKFLSNTNLNDLYRVEVKVLNIHL